MTVAIAITPESPSGSQLRHRTQSDGRSSPARVGSVQKERLQTDPAVSTGTSAMSRSEDGSRRQYVRYSSSDYSSYESRDCCCEDCCKTVCSCIAIIACCKINPLAGVGAACCCLTLLKKNK